MWCFFSNDVAELVSLSLLVEIVHRVWTYIWTIIFQLNTCKMYYNADTFPIDYTDQPSRIYNHGPFNTIGPWYKIVYKCTYNLREALNMYGFSWRRSQQRYESVIKYNYEVNVISILVKIYPWCFLSLSLLCCWLLLNHVITTTNIT